MTRRCGSVLLAVTLVALGVLSAACSKDAPAEPVRYGVRGKDIKPLKVDMPEKVLGLNVDRENVRKTVRQVEDTYVDSLSMFSLRQRKLLQATLQVSHLGPAADAESISFRRTIVNGLGGQTPREVRVSDKQVWLATGTNQRVVAWFEGRRFFVLSIRQDYPQPRSLLRTLLEAKL